jgi:predicted nucleic acid-binding protein
MDKIVVDNSVAIKWFFVEDFSAEARRVLGAYRNGTLALLAPDLMSIEFRNTVWKKQLFQGVSASEIQQVIDAFHLVNITLTPSAVLLDEAYRLAVLHKRAVYDALYLALSIWEGCPFVTADEKLFNAIRASFPNVIWIANWP